MENDYKNRKGFAGITIDDLSQQHQQYAEIIGVENLLLLAEYFGGSSLYIPKLGELLKNQKYARIMQEYDGSNIKALAVKYRVSESTVYRLVRDKREIIKAMPFEGQLRLF